MILNREDRTQLGQDIATIRNNFGSVHRPPGFTWYSKGLSDFARNPVKGATVNWLGNTMEYGMKQAGWVGLTFPAALFRSRFLPGATSAWSTGKLTWHGAVGMRHAAYPGLKALKWAAGDIPIVGRMIDEASQFIMGRHFDMRSVAMKMAGIPYSSSGLRVADQALTSVSKLAETSGKGFGRFVAANKISEPASYIHTGQAPRNFAKLRSSYGTLLKLQGALEIFQAGSIGIQIGTFVGDVAGSVVKSGYDTSEMVGRWTQKLIERSRTTEFATDMSAYMTQAALTERTKAIQYMQNARVNGAYRPGSETEYL